MARTPSGWPGLGLAFGLLLLLAAEAVLHTDAFFYRYRAVFAAGRAMDKLRYVEATVPALLIMGNSRVDNGFDPGAITSRLGSENHGRVFNFGLPGSDTRTLFGLLTRLDRKGLLGPGRIEAVDVDAAARDVRAVLLSGEIRRREREGCRQTNFPLGTASTSHA